MVVADRFRAIAVRAALVVALMAAFAWAVVRQRPSPHAPGLRIAAAADLRFALDELVAAFRRDQQGSAVEVTYGSSGTLYAQIVNGAPFDLFMSADVEYPRLLASKWLTVEGSEFLYAVGRLAVWVPDTSPLDVQHAGLSVVSDPRVTHVALANPAHAPYGRAAEAAMRTSRVFEQAAPKFVLGENVAQALQFVQSGTAEVGIVALSLALSPTVAPHGRYWLVPEELHPRLEQGGVVLRTDRVELAERFRAYLLADVSRAVLKRYGFSLGA